MYSPLSHSTPVYCDNISVVYLLSNTVQHQHMMHVKINLHFVCDNAIIRKVRVLHVPTTSQFVHIFTKDLSSQLFFEFRSSLNICRG
jgi:hypothetical protein